MRPSVTSPTGTVIGPPVSMTSVPRARPSVRVHGDRAHAVVAEVLLHLADEVRAGAGGDPLCSSGLSSRSIDDRRVDLGQLVGEDGLDHDALDLLDPADVALLGLSGRPASRSP